MRVASATRFFFGLGKVSMNLPQKVIITHLPIFIFNFHPPLYILKGHTCQFLAHGSKIFFLMPQIKCTKGKKISICSSITSTGNAGILPAIIRNNHNLQARCLRSQLEVIALMVRPSSRSGLPKTSNFPPPLILRGGGRTFQLKYFFKNAGGSPCLKSVAL